MVTLINFHLSKPRATSLSKQQQLVHVSSAGGLYLQQIHAACHRSAPSIRPIPDQRSHASWVIEPPLPDGLAEGIIDDQLDQARQGGRKLQGHLGVEGIRKGVHWCECALASPWVSASL